MTPAELAEAAAAARAKGHGYIQLVAPRKRAPRNWDRCRVIGGRPALMGRCVGELDEPGTWLFDVRVVDVEAWARGAAEGLQGRGG